MAMNEMNLNIDGIGEDIKLLEGLRTTRAMRRLKPDPVPIELVRKVCQAGTFAPSGGNRQPWFFIAVMEEERSRQRIDPDARMSGMMMPLPSSLSAVYHLIIVVFVMVMRGM